MTRLPSRCKKYSVGKEIGGAVYIHRVYVSLLPEPVKIASKHLPTDFDYTVVKYVEKESCVSFVLSPDFDSAHEPIVGDILRFDAKGSMQLFRQQADPYIYHHKWLFVMDDYRGFDVNKSKSRSITWLGLAGIDMQRIGRKNYWDSKILPLLPEVQVNWVSSEVMARKLKISSCELSHLRNTGRLRFTKIGNAYFYDSDNPIF